MTEFGKPNTTDFVCLALLGLLWGMPYALTKIALATIPPVTMVAGRVSLAAIALWLFVAFRDSRVPLSRSFITSVFIQGIITCVIPYTLIAFGQRSVDSALAAVLNSATPFFVCVISFVWTRHETLTPRRWLGVGVGLAGVVMVTGASATLGLGRTLPGELAIIAATFSSALSAVYGRQFTDVAPEVTAAGTLTSAAVALVPVSFLVETPLDITPSAASLVALAVNGVIATALGFALYFHLLRRIGSMGVASVGYLKPAFGVLIACTLVGEPLTWPVTSGLVAVSVGVAALNHRASKPRLIRA